MNQINVVQITQDEKKVHGVTTSTSHTNAGTSGGMYTNSYKTVGTYNVMLILDEAQQGSQIHVVTTVIEIHKSDDDDDDEQ